MIPFASHGILEPCRARPSHSHAKDRQRTWKTAAGLNFLSCVRHQMLQDGRLASAPNFSSPNDLCSPPSFLLLRWAGKDASMFMQIVFNMKQQEIMSTHIKRIASVPLNIETIHFTLKETRRQFHIERYDTPEGWRAVNSLRRFIRFELTLAVFRGAPSVDEVNSCANILEFSFSVVTDKAKKEIKRNDVKYVCGNPYQRCSVQIPPKSVINVVYSN